MNNNTLRKLQLTELQMLIDIDQVCRKYEITYFLVGGTMLGAERHKGFIPWDDDLDIAMLREDYNRFIDLCIEGVLGNNYFLQHTKTFSDYWLPFAKVRKNKTIFDEESNRNIECHKGIFIDIFPLDYVEKMHGMAYHLRAKTIKKLNHVILSRGLHVQAHGVTAKLIYVLLKPFSIKLLAQFRDRLCRKYTKGQYIINYGSNYKYVKQTMPSSIYLPATEVEFEGAKFFAPSQHIEYLKNLFGDWEKLPEPDRRVNHNPTKIIFDVEKE